MSHARDTLRTRVRVMGPAVTAGEWHMNVDHEVQALEIELASLARTLTGAGWRECLLCYVDRMLVEFGCDGTLRWTRNWRRERAPRATALERRLNARYAFCDCEVVGAPGSTGGRGVHDPSAPEWPARVPACTGVRTGSARPCSLWQGQRAAG